MAKAKTAKVENKTKVFSSQGFKENGITVLGSFVLVAFVATFITLMVLSVTYSHGVIRKSDGTVDGFKYGDKSKAGFKNKEDASGAGLPAGYKALFFGGIALTIVIIIGIGGGLRGSRGINRSNPFVKGQVYIRTKFQTIVFRVLTLCLAAIFLGSFFMDTSFADFLRKNNDADKIGINSDDAGAGIFLRRVFFGGTKFNIGYYQCFITSFILGGAIVFKKYNGVKVVFPMGFIGAVRTFGDITDGVGSDGAGNNIAFQRMVVEHLMLIFGPIFIIVANREKYTLKNMKAVIAYTFTMVFIPYVVYTITSGGRADRTVHDEGGGEISGIASGGKLGGEGKNALGQDVQEVGLQQHGHLFFGCMYVPFGFAIVFFLFFFVNFFGFKAEAKGNGGQRGGTVGKEYGRDVAINQGPAFKASFTNFTMVYRPKRELVAPFGVDPKEGEARKRK